MVKRWIAALAGALVLGSLVAAPASAHDALIASDPPDGAVLEVAPGAITLEYTGNILDINPALQVSDQDGTEHAVGAAQIDGKVVTWELVEQLPAGTFDVIWVVTSSDGHPIDGAFTFTVEAAAPEPSPEPEETSTPEVTSEPTAEESPQSPEPAPSDGPEPAATAEVAPEPVDAPADISDNAWAWLVGGGVVTLLVVVGATIAIRRNRDPNGPPGQH